MALQRSLHSPVLWIALALLAIVLALVGLNLAFEALLDWLDDWGNKLFWRFKEKNAKHLGSPNEENGVTVSWPYTLATVTIVIAIVAALKIL